MKAETKKRITVALRLSETLHAELIGKAKMMNLSKSEYLRQSIHMATIKPQANTRKMGECISQLNYMNCRMDSIAEMISDSKQTSSQQILDQLIFIKIQMRNITCMQK